MTALLFAKGLLLGLAIAAPLGPIGALCISRTLERGFWAGVAGGLGTALADASYALLAAAGFAVFAGMLSVVSVPLGLAGGLFMIWLGWRGMAPKPATAAATVDASRDLLQTTATTFLLTIANPATILSFAAIFAGLGLARTGDAVNAAIVVAGVFLGSLAWWFFLSGLIAALHHRLSPTFSVWVARLSGLVLIGFGVAAIAMGLRHLAAT
ncbi:LysE family translocator [Rhizobiaceae bacterium n13]|uniref:LysE family translocator n=1 Tax=Ferirhizobium litorale TaxID=2927786 RepID=A0AAE3QD65_9HYPH|nr:LysE family transporter [Fererhizobium litorale]MDI7863276.1 LysE family translocator [Fererhizobium litorale]MDI7922990.1 LysE family translocator [Fererhizobium litorale]